MKKLISAFLALVFLCSFVSCAKEEKFMAAIPTGFSKPTKYSPEITKGDYYVSTDGSDYNDGSIEKPFATIERARDEILNRKVLGESFNAPITVCVKAGEYKIDNLLFEAEDSGTKEAPIIYTAYGDGEVILNGGLTLKSSDFKAISDETKARLSDDAAEKVLCLDLKEYGLAKEDWGKIYAFGSYHTAGKYDGDTTGPLYSELFVNDKRMTLARYPDYNDFLKTGEVIEIGVDNDKVDWDEIRNPKGDTFKLDRKTVNRIKMWESLDGVWVFGYFKYDWADSTSPVKAVDFKDKTLTMEFAGRYGLKEEAPYYFFNLLEEITTQGEWYLDRENGLLYLYPPENFEKADISFSVSTKNLLELINCSNLTFRNFTFEGTRADAIVVEGNDNTITQCLIKNISGNAITVTGYNNLVSHCEICQTGKGGIKLTGGDRQTLKPGNNTAYNNYIHNWSEIYLTYQPAVSLYGVGNVCTHNEMHDSPHEAITYAGNDHIIEYNLIYDVVLQSSDAGAIYAGRNYTYYGVIVRYNAIYNIGSGEHRPDGIYFDDALSGQTAYGNLLVNIPKYGFHLGGGRDLTVKNNVIINAEKAFSYDDRARDGIVNNGWFAHHSGKGGDMWKNFQEVPYNNEVWSLKYPSLLTVSSDFNNIESPEFAANPSNSIIENNVIVDKEGSIGQISDAANRFSNIGKNAIYTLSEDPGFVDASKGIYSLKQDASVYEKLPGFDNIPIEKIGRE